MIAALALAVATALTFWSLGAFTISVVVAAIFAAAVAPGVWLARRLYGAEPGSAGSAWLVGPVWGFGLSSLALLVLTVAGVRGWWMLLAAPVIAAAVVAGLRPWRDMLRPVAIDRRDVLWVCLALLIVPVLVGRPFSRVGAEVPDGRAYRAYFTADFVWKMAVVEELAKGDLPPANPFLNGSPLNYYWLPHLMSGIERRALGDRVRLEPLLLTNATLFGLVLVAFLYALARQCGAPPPFATAGVLVAFIGCSFEGTERLIDIWRNHAPLNALRALNIEAASRWFYGAAPTDGLHRLLWWQPQHHAMAYCMGLSSMLVVWQARRLEQLRVMALAGSLLGVTILLSAFSAIMLTSMAIPVVGGLLIAAGHARRLLICAAVAAIPCAMGTVAALRLGYVSTGETLIVTGLNPLSVAKFWLNFPLNFGALSVILPAALVGLAWARDRAAWILGAPIAVAFLFYFFVDVRDMQGVYVGWRVGHIVFMLAAPLSAWLLWRVQSVVGRRRRVAVSVLAVLLVASLPTIVIDFYNTQDIDNRAQAASFPWTVVLTHDEVAGLDWIQRETPTWALVQPEPFARHSGTWSYVPSFAGRRMAAGLPISMIPFAPYERASQEVLKIFEATSPEDAYNHALRLRVDFVVIGPAEQQAHPALRKMFATVPHLFPLVFEQGNFSVYQVGTVQRRPPR